MNDIKNQIELVLKKTGMTRIDFDFLIDIAGLVIAARQVLAYIYPIRYFLKAGEPKQKFFDFTRSDLEQSLERLNEKNEEDFTEYLDKDENGGYSSGGRWLSYQAEIKDLSAATEKHLNNSMAAIISDFPEVVDSGEPVPDVNIQKLIDNSDWKCKACFEKNTKDR